MANETSQAFKKLENFLKKITEIEQKNHLYLGIKPDIESKHMFVREFRIEGSLNSKLEVVINEILKN